MELYFNRNQFEVLYFNQMFLLERLHPTTKTPIFLAVWAIQEKAAKRTKESSEERSVRQAQRSAKYLVTRQKLETETVVEGNI